MRSLIGLLVTFTGAVCVVFACGGRMDLPVGPDAAVDVGSEAPPADGCPTSEPADGVACPREGLLCEYGTDFDPRCNAIRSCSGGKWGPWYDPIGGGGGSKCPTKPPAIGPNPSACAPTRATVPVGVACTGDATCTYDGATCGCYRYCPSYPVRMPDCGPGVPKPCCDAKVQWNCFDGPAFCKTPRPRVGSPCGAGVKDGDSCAVSEPAECGQDVLVCRGGVWVLSGGACPISSGALKQDIAYLSTLGEEQLQRQLMSVRLASYRYKPGVTGEQGQHLGFIIEDMPDGSPAVLPSRQRVDLYGYTSMAVAALKVQQREIEALEARLRALEATCAKKP